LTFNRLQLQSVQFSFSIFGENLTVRSLADQLRLANGTMLTPGISNQYSDQKHCLILKKVSVSTLTATATT